MKSTHLLCVRFSALLLVLLFSSTIYAGSPKVDVCHVPPGNPDNFHTIRINQKALGAHLKHGDLAGACNAQCASLCDDGNACTIDDVADCETNGCPVVSEPVDCSDSNLCTDDICDPISGCANPIAVTCDPVDLCTSSACDPLTGVCEGTPVICDPGESCNPSNGLCVDDGPVVDCPCFDSTELSAIGTTTFCESNYVGLDLTVAFFTNGKVACSGEFCTELGDPSCGSGILQGVFDTAVFPITPDEDDVCQALVLATCPSGSGSSSGSPTAPGSGPELPLLRTQ